MIASHAKREYTRMIVVGAGYNVKYTPTHIHKYSHTVIALSIWREFLAGLYTTKKKIFLKQIVRNSSGTNLKNSYHPKKDWHSVSSFSFFRLWDEFYAVGCIAFIGRTGVWCFLSSVESISLYYQNNIWNRFTDTYTLTQHKHTQFNI